jgi:hypothetical protein
MGRTNSTERMFPRAGRQTRTEPIAALHVCVPSAQRAHMMVMGMAPAGRAGFFVDIAQTNCN